MFIARSFLLLFTVVSLSALHAQETSFPRVTASFNKAGLEEVFSRLHTITGFTFYYEPGELDSLKIGLEVEDFPLDKLLDSILNQTSLLYSTDHDRNVFIRKNIQIITVLNFSTDSVSAYPKIVKNPRSTYDEPAPKQQIVVSESRLYEIGSRTHSKPGNAIINGYIRDAKTGEPIVNASIHADKIKAGANTDQYGYYTLRLQPGSYTLNIQALGMKDANFQVRVYSDGTLNLELREQVTTLKEVVISALKTANINRVSMGVEQLSIASIKQVPMVFGEADILRVVLTLPGVKTVGEASTGFNVRGGSTDQNLILLNDATIYNPSHFFGMFSAFNPEIVKEVELYKSSIPARFGGRLSSVLDITAREGNKKKLTGTAGIGLITSRFNIEGPVIRDRTSFILGGRTTYANFLMKLLPDEYNDSRASFHDLNLNINHRINTKNDLYLTAYYSNDRFRLASDTTYSYGNRNLSLKWKHVFNNKLTGFITAGYDQYLYNVKSTNNKVNAFKLAFDINQYNFKTDFNYFLNSKHTIDFGTSTITFKMHPGSFIPTGSQSLVQTDIVSSEQAVENAVYIADRYNINTDLSIHAGIRFSMFNYLGPKDVAFYADGIPKDETSLKEVRSFEKGKIINTYQGPEYRLSIRYALTGSSSIKAGLNTMRQYLHMVSNTTSISPTDVWKLSDPNIKPQRGEQISIGFYKNLKSNTIETSVEVYYKRMYDYLDYKPGAKLILNHHLETDVISTTGKAYGIELMIKKPSGKLNGWVSYTYSRAMLKVDDTALSHFINKGKYYPANFDKPHDATMVGNFKVNHRFSLSLNVTYSTGRPITLPVARYYYSGSQRVVYSNRNQYRIPDYFRADFSMNIQGNHKVNQKTHNSWTIGIYNLTGRKNPFSVFFVSENGVVNGYKLSIFGSAIPFVNFNIRF